MDRRFILYCSATVFFSIIQAYILIEFIRLGLHKEIAFWVGAIFFGAFGFFFDDTFIWLMESDLFTRIAVVILILFYTFFSRALKNIGFDESFCAWILLIMVIPSFRRCVDIETDLLFYEVPMMNVKEDRLFIKIIKRRCLGRNIQYALFFMEDGFVALKTGGPFTRRKARIEASLLINQRLDELSIDEIIAMDKANNKILYKDIYNVELKKNRTLGKKVIVGWLTIDGNQKEEFCLWDEKDYEICKYNLYRFLPAAMIIES